MLHLPINQSQIALHGKSKRARKSVTMACILWPPSRVSEQLTNLAKICTWFRQRHQCICLLIAKKSRTCFHWQTHLQALACPRYKWSKERCPIMRTLNFSTSSLRIQVHKVKTLLNSDLTWLKAENISLIVWKLSSRAHLETYLLWNTIKMTSEALMDIGCL